LIKSNVPQLGNLSSPIADSKTVINMEFMENGSDRELELYEEEVVGDLEQQTAEFHDVDLQS